MTFFQLLLRNLIYHWRGNLALLLGVAVGTAVLTGALLVGDSLRGSLRELALEQLGWVDRALVAGRFFREELAKEVPAAKTSPAILLQGTATRTVESSAKKSSRFAGKVTVLGVEQSFWPKDFQWKDADMWGQARAAVVLNTSLADALQARVGDEIDLHVQKTGGIPQESLMGKKKTADVVQSFTVTVRQIVPDRGLGRFALKPSPQPPRNAFVPLPFLQKQLDLAGKANALFAGKLKENAKPDLAGPLTLADWGLQLRSPEDRARTFVKYLDPHNQNLGAPKQNGKLKRLRWKGRVPEELAKQADSEGQLTFAQVIAYYRKQRDYLSLESQQMFLEPVVSQAATAALNPSLPLSTVRVFPMGGERLKGIREFESILVYLADTISAGKNEVPYVIVAAVGSTVATELKPFGYPLEGKEIALARWPGSPLKVKPGDPIDVVYYVSDDQGQLIKKTEVFTLAGFFSLKGKADDPDITPPFAGITDKLDMGNWENPPFPFNSKRIKPVDEEFWKRYRTTPRAYVNLKTAQQLWGSRFGKLTSIRIPLKGKDAQAAAKEITAILLEELKPEQGGFVFQDVKALGLKAGEGSTDFGGYFLGFSFFLIVSALLLVGLLFRLNLDRRAAEMGLLLAVGFRRRLVRLLVLSEGSLLALAGGLVGTAGAVGYAVLLLEFLSARWPGEQRLNFLEFHAGPASFLIGYFSALVVSVLTILWASRVLGKVAPKSLLAGETTPATSLAGQKGKWSWSGWTAGLSGVGAVACLAAGFLSSGPEAQAMSFFGSGAFLLSALLACLWSWMRHARGGKIIFLGKQALARLGARNAARHPVRSLLTVGLLASAVFLVTAVQSFHRQAGSGFLAKDGGSGGFTLLAETDVPIFQDLNSPDGRADFFAPQEPPALLKEVKFFPFRVRSGDDTSCLNLYQPLRPRILGVPATLIERGGFHFSAISDPTEAEKENPWRILDRKETEAIPAFADANSAEYILHVKLGQTLVITGDQGQKLKLRLAGLLQESIFQSELLIADWQFRKRFPRHEGFSFFLIDTPRGLEKEIKAALLRAGGKAGLEVMATTGRLDSFLAVENTYLATFQALGGFGLLLGALGLAVVLLRSVWERRGELALLRALGFRRRSLGWLVVAENGYLLLLGLGTGVVSAALSVAPHLIGSGEKVPWLELAGLLVLVLLVGLGAAAGAMMGSLRAPLLQALRKE